MRRKLSTRENEGVTGVDAGVELAYCFIGYGNGLVRVLAEGDRIDIVDSEAAADESGSAVFQQRKVQIGSVAREGGGRSGGARVVRGSTCE